MRTGSRQLPIVLATVLGALLVLAPAAMAKHERAQPGKHHRAAHAKQDGSAKHRHGPATRRRAARHRHRLARRIRRIARRHRHAKRTRTYEVTIENLASGQPLTPPVVATHRGRHRVFKVGHPASLGVREIAENGNSAPLLAQFEANPFGHVADFTESADGPLVPTSAPGGAMFDDAVTLTLEAERGARWLSWVSMLICTNDGFTGVDSLRLPHRVGATTRARTDGYDAHTERNTEDFADMVPPCQALIGVSSGDAGTGVSDPALAEGGVIAHHEGIQGGADLLPEVHGWDDPVARIEVERID